MFSYISSPYTGGEQVYIGDNIYEDGEIKKYKFYRPKDEFEENSESIEEPIESKSIVYPLQMIGKQAEVYYSILKETSAENKTTVSNFVDNDGRYLAKEVSKNFDTTDNDFKSFDWLYSHCVKYAEIARMEIKRSTKTRPGCSYVNVKSVEGGGTDALAKILTEHGFEEFKLTAKGKSFSRVCQSTSANLPKKKGKRFAVITGKTSVELREEIISVLSSKENIDG